MMPRFSMTRAMAWIFAGHAAVGSGWVLYLVGLHPAALYVFASALIPYAMTLREIKKPL